MTSGVPSGPRPSAPGSSRCASSTDLPVECTWAGTDSWSEAPSRATRATWSDWPSRGPTAIWRSSLPPRSTSMITQSAISPASSRAHRWSVTASLNVLLSSRTLVSAMTASSRRVMAAMAGSPTVSRAAFAAGRAGRFPGLPSGSAASSATPPAAPGKIVTIRTGGSPGSSAAAAVRATSSGPSAVRIRQFAVRGLPVRATAASCVWTAALKGRSMKALSGLPVAYPDGAPSSAAALLLARLIVPSCSSRNSGAGACWKTACNSRRSACTDSGATSAGEGSRPPEVAEEPAPIASIAASSSVSAASISQRGSTPGRPAA